MTLIASEQPTDGDAPIRYWPLVSVFMEGESETGDCEHLVALFIYEVGFGATWQEAGRSGSVHNPGWDLDKARQELGGDGDVFMRVRDADRWCRHKFSLAPWRRIPAEAWRVLPMVFLNGEPAESFEYFMHWETLGEMRARSHGDKTVVADPIGRRHTLSLRPWDDLPALGTRLSVRFAPDSGRRTTWWRRAFARLLYNAVEAERARGLDPSPRRFNPSQGMSAPRSADPDQ